MLQHLQHLPGLDYIPVSADKRPLNAGWLTTTYSASEIKASQYVGVRTGTPVSDGGFLCVIDIDVKRGDGEAAWSEYVGDRDLPDTLTVRTRSGGRHLYYRTTEPGGSPRPCAHVEIQGTGTYVVAPPSPGYEVISDLPIAWAPMWLEELVLGAHATRRGWRSAEDMASDEPVVLDPDTLRAWCAEHPVEALSQDILSLLRNEPIAGPGQRHAILRLRLIPSLLGTFGPGVTLESLLALVAGDYPGRVMPHEDRRRYEDALQTARRKCDPAESQNKSAADAFVEGAVAARADAVRTEAAEAGLDPDSLPVRMAAEMAGQTNQEALAWTFIARGEYIYSAGEWYQWVGSHWQRLDQPPVHAVGDVMRSAGLRKDSDMSRTKRKAVIEEAAEICANLLRVKMDAQRGLTAFPNGTWTGSELRASRREDYITRCSTTPLVLGARHPQWDLFLEQASCGDETWVRHLQYLLGAGFAQNRPELLPVFFGNGANLKSTILQTVMHAFGDSLCTSIPADTFTSDRDRHTSYIGRTLGAKLAVSTELRADRQLNWPAVKKLVGETPFPVQVRMGGNVIDMVPTCALAIDMNGIPVSMEADRSERRRLRMLPWEYQIDVTSSRPGWHKQFYSQVGYLEAVVAWVIGGSMIEKEPRCAREIEASDRVFASSDPLADWLAECCSTSPAKAGDLAAFASRRELRESYEFWARGSRDRLSTRELYVALGARFREGAHHGGIRGFWGVRVSGQGAGPFG